MGRGKAKREYKAHLDGERLPDDTTAKTSLQPSPALEKPISPPPIRQDRKGNGKNKGKGKRDEPKKPPLTHFLCLPLVNEQSRPKLQRGLEELGQTVEKDGLVPRKAIRPVGTLHLTLGVMSLDDESLQGAGRCLEELDLKALLRDAKGGVALDAQKNQEEEQTPDHQGLSIHLKGLVPMQSPQKTSILYAQPEDRSERLQRFASALRDHFTKEGFLIEDKRALKLHATLVNTIYAKPKGRGGRNRNPQRASKAAESTPEREPNEGDTSIAGNAQEEYNLTQSSNPSTTGPLMSASAEGSAQAEEQKSTAPPDPSTAETEVPPTGEKLDRSEGHGPDAKSWMRFDARGLIESYKEFLWAEDVQVDKVQICKMGAEKLRDEQGEVVDEKYTVVFEKMI
jgi:activating signal cointegrator complex subunit 1